MDILLDPELSPDLVCTRMPFDVDCNSVFVIDMSKLSNPKDIACDDMGVWKWNGSYRRWLSVDVWCNIYAGTVPRLLPISTPFEHRVLRERMCSLNLLRDSLRKVNRYLALVSRHLHN